MTVTTTTRLGIHRWSDDADSFTRTQLDADHASLEQYAMRGEDGTVRPAAGVQRRLFYETDAKELSYDDGTDWHGVPLLDQPSTFSAPVGGLDEPVAAMTGTSGTVTADLASGVRWWTLSPTGNVTLAFTNVPAGRAVQVVLRISQGGTARSITLPAGGKWLDGQPIQVANQRCLLTLVTVDGGSTWDVAGSVTV